MKKNIKKVSLINLLIVIIIIAGGLIQLCFEGQYVNYRRLRAIIGYFIIIPLSLISLFLTFIIFKYYYDNKFKKRLIYLYSVIPAVILFIYLFINLIKIILSVIFKN